MVCGLNDRANQIRSNKPGAASDQNVLGLNVDVFVSYGI
jgi:hypothetical protein